MVLRKREVDSDLDSFQQINSSGTDLRLDSSSFQDLDVDGVSPMFARYPPVDTFSSVADAFYSPYSLSCDMTVGNNSCYAPDAYCYSYRPRDDALVGDDLILECQPVFHESEPFQMDTMYDTGFWAPSRVRASSEMIRRQRRGSSFVTSIPRSYSSVECDPFYIGPQASIAPIAQVAPVAPVAPVAQVAQVAPVTPVTSVTSVTPSRPVSVSSVASTPTPPTSSASATDLVTQESAQEAAEKSSQSKHSKKKRSRRDEDVNIARLKSGEDNRTCVMLRNIPNRYHTENLLNMLTEAVGDHYDIVSIPMDQTTGRNLGYCFVKFDSVDDLIRAYEHVCTSCGYEV